MNKYRITVIRNKPNNQYPLYQTEFKCAPTQLEKLIDHLISGVFHYKDIVEVEIADSRVACGWDIIDRHYVDGNRIAEGGVYV